MTSVSVLQPLMFNRAELYYLGLRWSGRSCKECWEIRKIKPALPLRLLLIAVTSFSFFFFFYLVTCTPFLSPQQQAAAPCNVHRPRAQPTFPPLLLPFYLVHDSPVPYMPQTRPHAPTPSRAQKLITTVTASQPLAALFTEKNALRFSRFSASFEKTAVHAPNPHLESLTTEWWTWREPDLGTGCISRRTKRLDAETALLASRRETWVRMRVGGEPAVYAEAIPGAECPALV
ncbi:hypothetical protein ST47_g6509 [Ascochyta rabiei]|uniref:Uncharacterized protein n=1 Tax=Didymella rabiei TaxID=5454 RepID=A0A163CBG9_DIDRA|nr:hypothetical protein ST47_g6509 [Ascochyta rabiei]